MTSIAYHTLREAPVSYSAISRTLLGHYPWVSTTGVDNFPYPVNLDSAQGIESDSTVVALLQFTKSINKLKKTLEQWHALESPTLETDVPEVFNLESIYAQNRRFVKIKIVAVRVPQFQFIDDLANDGVDYKSLEE